MGDFKRLVAWQQAQELGRELSIAFKSRSARDYPGLRNQVLRAAESIPSALAEGCAKRSRRELARFAEMAYASAKEIESQLIFARNVEVLSAQSSEDLGRKTDHVARLCFGLMRLPPED
ncbi:MAG: four helix bundle protein [bacterium]